MRWTLLAVGTFLGTLALAAGVAPPAEALSGRARVIDGEPDANGWENLASVGQRIQGAHPDFGGDRLGGMYGTGPASASESAASAAWEAAYVARHGALPVLAYVKETYDATVALALAAQAAGRLDGVAIRDRLRGVGGAPGTVVTAGPRGVAEALGILARGGEIDYQGASGSMDWDGNGDLRRGHIGIWRFTGDERIEDVGTVPFER